MAPAEPPAPRAKGRTLHVVVDGVPLPDDAARAFWSRFSTYMEENRGDLAGFAASEGFISVHPEMGAHGAVLVASKTGAQKPYASAKSRRGS